MLSFVVVTRSAVFRVTPPWEGKGEASLVLLLHCEGTTFILGTSTKCKRLQITAKFVQAESSEKLAYSLPRRRRTKGAKPLKFVPTSEMPPN